MFQRAKAGPSKRAKFGLVAALLFVAGLVAIPQMGTASATEGNMSTACAGQDGVAAGKLKAFSNFQAYVNGAEIPTGIRKIDQYVKAGDTVTINFTLKPECSGTYVGISSFSATSANDTTVAQYRAQKLYQRDGRVFDTTPSTIQVVVPPCYFQVDVNTGGPYVPGDFTLDRAGRLLLAAQGGSDADCSIPTTTTTAAPTTTTTAAPTTTTTAAPTTTTTAAPTTTTSTPPTTIVEVPQPSAAFTKVCSVDGSGFTGKLTNKGNAAADFQVYVNGTLADTINVGAKSDSSKTWTFASLNIAKQAKADIEIKVNGSTIAKTSIVNDCYLGTATIAQECNTTQGSGGIITLNNKASSTTNTFNVYRDGREVSGSPIEVKAGETRQLLLATEEDVVAKIRVVSAAAGVDQNLDVALNCEEAPVVTVPPTTPPEVLNEVVTQPQLAYTGADLRPWAFGGLLSIGLGLALIRRAQLVRAHS